MSAIDVLLAVIAVYAFLNLLPQKRAYPHLSRAGQQTRDRAPKEPKPATWLETLKHAGIYWGVEFQTPTGAPNCARARELSGEQFPIKNAPTLPPEDCDCLHCRCTYRPLLEKRLAPRRLSPDRRAILRYEPRRPARRSGSDRRRSCRQWDNAHST